VNPFEFRPYYTPFTFDTIELAALVKRCVHYSRGTNYAWKDPPVSAPQVVSSSVVCSTCMGSKVLRHFVSADEPCPDCPPDAKRGPSEWTLTESVLDRHEAEFEAWHYTFKRGDAVAMFRVLAWIKPHTNEPPSTIASRFTHYDPQYGYPLFNESVPSVKVFGECCVTMVRDRLLCGLRDGTVKS
jgi:hypothetical protein